MNHISAQPLLSPKVRPLNQSLQISPEASPEQEEDFIIKGFSPKILLPR